MDEYSLPGWEWANDVLERRDYEENTMSLTARKPKGEDFEQFPSGTHVARCWRLVDMGTQDPPPQFEKNKPRHQVLVSWESCDERMSSGEPYSINEFYTVSLHQKAKLREHLEAWRGKPFTEAELEGFELTNILGHACMLNVIHEKREGSDDTRARVHAVMALPKGQKAPDLVNETVVFSLDDATVNWDKLPEWLQERIQKSHEWTGKGQERGHLGVPDGEVGEDVPF